MAFIPIVMENPKGGSAIIMEIGRSSILFKQGAPRRVDLPPKIMQNPKGSSAIMMEISKTLYNCYSFVCVFLIDGFQQ